jgi:agmatine/peptidylarginine deiminase
MMKKLPAFLFLIGQLMLYPLFAQQQAPQLTHEMTPEEEQRKHEIGRDFITSTPPAHPVRAVAEFEEMESVLIRYPFGIPMALIVEMAEDCEVKTIVQSESQKTLVLNQYIAAGVDTANCEWLIAPTNSYWTRDYGPWFVVDSSNVTGICDFPYNRPRPDDDNIPVVLAGQMEIPLYGMDLIHTGGNWMCDGMGMAASTELVWTENPGLTHPEIDSLVWNYLGIGTYHVLPDPLGEYIEHIDCWGKFLDVDKVLIGQVPESDWRYDDFEYVASYFAQQTSSYGNPYQVYRVYTPGNYPYTPYTNSLVLNNKVFVPQTGSPWDDEALDVYGDAMPGYDIIGVLHSNWQNTDALHCRAIGIAATEMLYINHMPLLGNVNFDLSYRLNAGIIPYSGAGLIADSLKCYYKTDDGPYQALPLEHQGGSQYQALLPFIAPGCQVSYYLHAADSTGRTKNHPYIGAPDPHLFNIEYATDLLTDPDTLFFQSVEEMLNGKSFNLYNFTGGSLIVNDIETESQGHINWFIDPWDYSLPITLANPDTLSLTVKISPPVNNQLDDVVKDTLDIVTANGNSHVIIMVTVQGRWTGLTSANWSIASNWSDNIVPSSTTDIYIPADSPNWPVFQGNLVIGETCGNIILDAASQLTVTGSLTINPGKQLIIGNEGVLYQLTGE